MQPVSWIAFQGLTAGTYGLQLSVAADGDEIGSVKHVVDARLHTLGSCAASDVFVAASAPAGGGPFPVPAEAMIEGNELIAGIELYTREREDANHVAVRFEVTRPDSDLPIASTAPTLTQSADRLFARGTLSIADLSAGDYIVHALVTDTGRCLGSVSRSFWRISRRH